MNGAQKALDGWTENEWVKRSAGDPWAACLLGRVVLVVRETDEYRSTVNALRDVLAEQYGTRDIAHWNDDPGRTFPEVQAVLEKAAVRLDEQADRGVDWG